MRSVWAGFLLAALVPQVGAASIWADPEGDVETEVYGAPAPKVGEWGQADLLGLDLAEEADRLVLSLRPSAKADLAVRTEFRVGGHPYALLWGMNGTPYARLLEVTSFGDSFVAVLAASWDKDLVTSIPRALLRDWTGSAPRTGTVLDGFETAATAASLDGPDPDQGFFCCTAAVAVKDTAGPGSYTVTAGGGGGDGSLRIGSDWPSRAHNGGPARFVFDAWIAGEPGRSVSLGHGDLPEGWSLHLPPESLSIPSGGRLEFQVMAEAPSRHVHGSASSFIVQATDGNSSAWTELGVYPLRVPQPSGHHPTLSIHSRAQEGTSAGLFRNAGYPSGLAYMNTLQDDPADEGVPVDSTDSSFGGSVSRWSACLDPGLLIGVQLDGTRTGTLDLRLEAQRPHGNLTVSAALSRFGPGRSPGCDAAALRLDRNETVLAQAESVTLPPGQVHLDVATVHSQPVPAEPGAMLVLEVEVSFPIPDSQAPAPLALHGGTLDLPWLEYEEPAPEWAPGTPTESQAPQAIVSDAPRTTASPAAPFAAALLGAGAWVLRRRRN